MSGLGGMGSEGDGPSLGEGAEPPSFLSPTGSLQPASQGSARGQKGWPASKDAAGDGQALQDLGVTCWRCEVSGR